ncbi:hypothetical protein SH2C18_05050 [Clostridium sediminicola]|uniref:prepilin-type N-terminal cleavage/methylation domain-containing protein n=1 Tax=Clostridium sediminicola TaxID=3114879 RepID=UPI0031F1E287
MNKIKECIIMKLKKNKKGFSFVEIIIGIAISLILATYSIPKYKEYKGKALNLRAVDSGRKIYGVCIDSYINNGEFSSAKIQDEVTNLLGLTATVTDSEDDVTVVYPLNKKKYTLEITGNDSSFIIKEGENKIYSSKEETSS